jgi:UDPglucose 6-dehydrogenase
LKVGIVGTGYVGAVTGVCMAHIGHDVICCDVDPIKIKRFQACDSPIHEPSLNEYLQHELTRNKIQFTTDVNEIVNKSDIIFLCIGTPPKANGEVDMHYIDECLNDIVPRLKQTHCLVFKSTVPVGTAFKAKKLVKELCPNKNIYIGSNPEFLKEGAAVSDFLNPERIIIGVEDEITESLLRRVYEPLIRKGHPVLAMDHASAELAKYACNAMLATRISFINEIANICTSLGANVNQVRQALISDSRIGSKFLSPSLGYGGQCLPKDVQGLIFQASMHDLKLNLIEAVNSVNNSQKELLFHKYKDWSRNKQISKVSVWGTAFKAGTDDIRESGAMVLINNLLSCGLEVHAHDPVAFKNTQAYYSKNKRFYISHGNPLDTLAHSQALFICTEWELYRNTKLQNISKLLLSPSAVFDGRNLFNKDDFTKQLDIDYFGIGQQNKLQKTDMVSASLTI